MSDEIPVGSPPVPPGRHAAPGGWYADPAKQGQERYWDGWQWTRNVREAEAPQQWAGQQQGPQQQWAQQPQQQWNQPAQGWQQTPAPGPANYQWKRVPSTNDGVPLAGWWWRVLAAIIDALVLAPVTLLLFVLTGGGTDPASQQKLEAYLTQILESGEAIDWGYLAQLSAPSPTSWVLSGLIIAVYVLYSALMLRSRSATVGKLATGLRVVPVDQGQSTVKLSWSVAIVRPLVYQLMGQFGLLALLDALWPLWDRKNQALHDKIVRTQVVKTR